MHESYEELDATGLADLVKTGAVSLAELAETALALIDARNPATGAVIDTWPEEIALAQQSFRPDAPFAGVPFLIKDLVCHAAGHPCESGSRLAAGLTLPHDSFLMARFRRAGLVPLGRTKAPEFGFSSTCEPVLHGPVRNPWDRSRSSGGSSGGAAAAVAAGMVPMAHANDAGGSIRIPAAACGLVGLKPSRGRVSAGPDMGEGLFGFATELAVTRSVRDTARLLDAVHGTEPGDPYGIASPEHPFAKALGASVRGLRIAVSTTAPDGTQPHPDMAALVASVARTAEAMGCHIAEAAPDIGVDPEAFLLATARLWCASIAAGVHQLSGLLGRPIDASTLEAGTLLAVEWGRGITVPQLLEALAVCNLVSRSTARFFADHDLLLCPTLPGIAQPLSLFDHPPAGMDGLGWVRWLFSTTPYTPLFNMTGQPVISLPLGQSAGGLPLGVQFAAPMGREDWLIAMAAALEEALPWAGRRPAVPQP